MIRVVFLLRFFRNISKTAEGVLTKKIEPNHGVLVYKKSLMSEHRKNYILRDINEFIKMSVSSWQILCTPKLAMRAKTCVR